MKFIHCRRYGICILGAFVFGSFGAFVATLKLHQTSFVKNFENTSCKTLRVKKLSRCRNVRRYAAYEFEFEGVSDSCPDDILYSAEDHPCFTSDEFPTENSSHDCWVDCENQIYYLKDPKDIFDQFLQIYVCCGAVIITSIAACIYVLWLDYKENEKRKKWELEAPFFKLVKFDPDTGQTLENPL